MPGPHRPRNRCARSYRSFPPHPPRLCRLRGLGLGPRQPLGHGLGLGRGQPLGRGLRPGLGLGLKPGLPRDSLKGVSLWLEARPRLRNPRPSPWKFRDLLNLWEVTAAAVRVWRDCRGGIPLQAAVTEAADPAAKRDGRRKSCGKKRREGKRRPKRLEKPAKAARGRNFEGSCGQERARSRRKGFPRGLLICFAEAAASSLVRDRPGIERGRHTDHKRQALVQPKSSRPQMSSKSPTKKQQTLTENTQTSGKHTKCAARR